MPQPNRAARTSFREELVAVRSNIRAFAHSLCRSPEMAEDLAQDTLLKAWKARASFKPGSSMKAWCFTILKNQFYSDKRRDWRREPLDPNVAAETLKLPERNAGRLDLLAARNALEQLPQAQREAVLLVGVGGLSYKDAAEICDCGINTLKSRVFRGRKALQARIGSGDLNFTPDDDLGSSEVFEHLLAETEDLIETD